jgi:uncharacterized membrane protein
MSDIERYYPRPTQSARQHRQAMQNVAHQAQQRAARIMAKHALATQVLNNAMEMALKVEEAARLAPSGIPEYRMIAALANQSEVRDAVDW